MITDIIGKRYAEAIYKVAEEEKKVESLYDELKKFVEIYKTNIELREVIEQPEIDINKKKDLAEKIFAKVFSATAMNVILYLIEKERISIIDNILKQYLKIYYEKYNYIDVEVIFATEPTKEQKEKLIKKVEKNTGKKVNLSIKIDPSIIAGGIIKIGDKIIDGSLKRQFEKLKVSL